MCRIVGHAATAGHQCAPAGILEYLIGGKSHAALDVCSWGKGIDQVERATLEQV